MTAVFGTDPYGGQNFPFGHRLTSSQFNNLVNWVRGLDSAAELETVCSICASSQQTGADSIDSGCYDATLGFWILGGNEAGAGTSAIYICTSADYVSQDATVTDVEEISGIDANGSGTVVACGNTTANTAQKILSSTDGVSWTVRNLSGATTDVCNHVAWDAINSQFLVAMDNDKIERSPNGTTWTAATGSVGSGAGLTWTDIAQSNSILVAMPNDVANTEVASSTDGATWTARTVASDQYNAICYSGSDSKFFVVSNSAILGSADGLTWAAGSATLPSDANATSKLCATTNLVLLSYADASSNHFIAASDDGCATWRKVAVIDVTPRFLEYYDGQLMFSTNNANSTLYSTVKIIASL